MRVAFHHSRREQHPWQPSSIWPMLPPMLWVPLAAAALPAPEWDMVAAEALGAQPDAIGRFSRIGSVWRRPSYEGGVRQPFIQAAPRGHRV